MKHTPIIVVALLASAPAMAGGPSHYQPVVAQPPGINNNVASSAAATANASAKAISNANANASGIGYGGAGGAGGTGGQAISSSYGGNYRAAASSAVGIGSTNNPCGSVFGLGVQGIPFGVSLGIPFVHESCNTRITALSLDQCRSRACRIAVGLADPNVRRAMEAAGEFVVYGPGQEAAYRQAFVNYQAQTRRRTVRRKPCRC